MVNVVMYTFTYKDENNHEHLAYARSKERADELEKELKAKGLSYSKKKSFCWSCKVV